jgi:hypothetical protein
VHAHQRADFAAACHELKRSIGAIIHRISSDP